MDSKVSCSQIARRALARIRTHDPLVESDVLTIRPLRFLLFEHQHCKVNGMFYGPGFQTIYMSLEAMFSYNLFLLNVYGE
jgi:hypothetical protein